MFLCTSYRHSYSVSNETLMTPSIVIRCRGVRPGMTAETLEVGTQGALQRSTGVSMHGRGHRLTPETPRLCTACQWSAEEMQTRELDKNGFRGNKDSVSNVC